MKNDPRPVQGKLEKWLSWLAELEVGTSKDSATCIDHIWCSSQRGREKKVGNEEACPGVWNVVYLPKTSVSDAPDV